MNLILLWQTFIWPGINSATLLIAAGWAAVKWIPALIPKAQRALAVGDIVATLPERFDKAERADAAKLAAITALSGEVSTLRIEMETAKEDILAIKHEVKHNGGTSMKDALARVEAAVKPTTEGEP